MTDQQPDITDVLRKDKWHITGVDAERAAQTIEDLRAELSRLQAENEALRDSVAAKADRIDRLGEMVERLQDGGQGVEPIYQYRKADGTWIDQDKHSHDYNVRHGSTNVRVVYAQPPAAPALVPLQDKQVDELIARKHFDPKYIRKDSDEVVLSWYRLGVHQGVAEFCRINGLTVGGDGGEHG